MVAHVVALLYAWVTLMKIKGIAKIYAQKYSSTAINYISIPTTVNLGTKQKNSEMKNIVFKHSLAITIVDIIFIAMIVGFAYTRDTLLISLLLYLSMRIIDKLYINYLEKMSLIYSQ